MSKKEPKITILDGGVTFDFICVCGHKMRVREWGMVYKRTKKGRIISPRFGNKNPRKCKCGREFIFIAIPDVGYKELSVGERC